MLDPEFRGGEKCLKINRKIVFWTVVFACAVALIIGMDDIVSLAEAEDGTNFRDGGPQGV